MFLVLSIIMAFNQMNQKKEGGIGQNRFNGKIPLILFLLSLATINEKMEGGNKKVGHQKGSIQNEIGTTTKKKRGTFKKCRK